MELDQEILKKVKLIEIHAKRMVDEVTAGQYKSHFKGQGVQFSEHRTYVPGDDIRHIDWKVSARTKDPMVKKYDEERELVVFLIVDLSASGEFGTKFKLKSEVAAEVSAMLAYAASHTGDKVGALIFTSDVEKIVPPKKGRSHVLRIVRDVLTHKPKNKTTDLKKALEVSERLLKHKGIVFIISDFLTEGYEHVLKRVARRHEVVALNVLDGHEWSMPEDMGRVLFENPETGEEFWVDTSQYAFKEWYKKFKQKHREKLTEFFNKNRIEEVTIDAREDYAETLVRFFGRRR